MVLKVSQGRVSRALDTSHSDLMLLERNNDYYQTLHLNTWKTQGSSKEKLKCRTSDILLLSLFEEVECMLMEIIKAQCMKGVKSEQRAMG